MENTEFSQKMTKRSTISRIVVVHCECFSSTEWFFISSLQKFKQSQSNPHAYTWNSMENHKLKQSLNILTFQATDFYWITKIPKYTIEVLLLFILESSDSFASQYGEHLFSSTNNIFECYFNSNHQGNWQSNGFTDKPTTRTQFTCEMKLICGVHKSDISSFSWPAIISTIVGFFSVISFVLISILTLARRLFVYI